MQNGPPDAAAPPSAIQPRQRGSSFTGFSPEGEKSENLPVKVRGLPSVSSGLIKILAIWAFVTVPMGLLVWIVAPAIIPHTSRHPMLVHWMLIVVGMMWQFLVSLAILRRELGGLHWPSMKRGSGCRASPVRSVAAILFSSAVRLNTLFCRATRKGCRQCRGGRRPARAGKTCTVGGKRRTRSRVRSASQVRRERTAAADALPRTGWRSTSLRQTFVTLLEPSLEQPGPGSLFPEVRDNKVDQQQRELTEQHRGHVD